MPAEDTTGNHHHLDKNTKYKEEMIVNKTGQFVFSPFAPPVGYDPPVLYKKIIQERDVMVTMRDGCKVCVDIYRPDTKEKVPAILSFAPHFKD